MSRLTNRLEEINKGLPLIPKDIPMEKQIAMAEKKVKFMDENSSLFISTGEYMMTLASVQRELKEMKDACGGKHED